MRAIAPVLLAIATLAAIACAFREAKQTPDIDATVEARVRGTQEAEAAIEATVQVRVAATLTAPYPAATPYPTATPHPTPTPYPTLTPEQEERLILSLYMCFQTPGFAELVAGEVDLPKELIAPLYEDWELFHAIMLLAFQEDPSLAADFPEMEAIVSVMCPDEGADDGQIQGLQATIGLRGYAAQQAGGPGAIYIGDGNFWDLAGPSVYPDFMDTYGIDLGDDDGEVPLYAIEQYKWIFESDYYRSLLAKARLTNPTQLVSKGRRIELQHTCINGQLLWCKHLQAYFVPNVQERTKGQVTINITSFPELGLAGTDTASLLADGTLSMTEIYGGYVGGEFPTLAVQYIWGLWPDHETHYRVLTNIAPNLDKVYEEELGAQVLMRNWIAGDDQFFFSNKRLENPEDFVGLKTRSHSAELSDWINHMGAAAQFMAFTEVYTALERGILDAGVTGANPGLGQRWYEVTTYMNGRLFSFNSTTNVVNGDVWAEIPADIQQILLEEGAKQELEALRLAVIQNLTGLQRNINAGLEFVEFSPEIRRMSFRAGAESVLPNWLERLDYPRYGQETVDVFNNKIGPFVGLEVQLDPGSERGFKVADIPITQGPHAGKTMEQALSE